MEELVPSPARQCFECDTEIALIDEPVFVVDAERVLCAACAGRRGGEFDATDNRWTKAPQLDRL